MKLKRGIKSAAALIGLLMLAWGLIMWQEWLPSITEEQRAALELMRKENQQARGERNAWQLFWTLPYEIPDQHRAEILKRDIAALNALPVTDSDSNFISAAEGRFPRRWEPGAAAHRFCSPDGDCLASVRAEPEAAAAELVAAESELRALRELGRYDHIAVPHRSSFASPIPAFGRAITLQLLDAALRFDRGDRDEALTTLCSDTLAWRRLKGRADTLIFEMLNISYQLRALRLYADIRAELPPEHAVPAQCQQAFAPAEISERQSCDVYRFEFRLSERLMEPGALQSMQEGDGDSQWLRGLGAELLINEEATLAFSALNFSRICAAIPRPLDQPPAKVVPSENGCGWVGRAFNPMGCVLAPIAMPAYSDYWLRDRDWEGGLRALQLAEWLVTQDDPASAFAARPESLRQFEQSQVEAGPQQVSIRLLRPRSTQQAVLSLPLPGSRVGGTPAP